ncbi:DUF4124 domain-containing protein [Massilia sp. CF038]|uniref:DUF4124 domain-containing protein n=1 Tax=Massilia sp. CF038 TaxID=1881045 RepID=UPI0009216EE3|nr:DUF4124 domain-containing protein [Massilia sp. CF038]SHH68399.1 protein of unknown function [Massilia sp. CF038]
MMKTSVALIVGCFLASGAMAQQMYKVIGADGKITYSDRPALEKANKMSVMKAYTLRPVEEEKKKEAAKPEVAMPAPDPNASITPEVEDAMVSILTMNELSIKSLPICSATDASARAFSASTTAWKKRNAPYIEQQKRLLMEVMSPHKRAELLEKSSAAAADTGRSIPPTAQGRRDWCAGTIAELDSGRSDINKPFMLTIPITKYRAK